MAIIKTVEGKTPQWGKNCFIAENAVLTGDCILGDDCSIWYSAVLRSDVDAIRCGNRVNVQDCACIHQPVRCLASWRMMYLWDMGPSFMEPQLEKVLSSA